MNAYRSLKLPKLNESQILDEQQLLRLYEQQENLPQEETVVNASYQEAERDNDFIPVKSGQNIQQLLDSGHTVLEALAILNPQVAAANNRRNEEAAVNDGVYEPFGGA